MKNNECEIQIILPSGWKQTYRQASPNSWTQTTNGEKRMLTAEQLLSHLLPLLVGEQTTIIKVIPNKEAAE